MIDRLPPQSLEAEQSVLGSILIDRDAVVEIAEFLRPEDFYRQANGTDLRGDAGALRAARAGRHRHGRRGARARRTSSRGSAAARTSRASATRRPPPSTPSSTRRIVERKAVLRNLIAAAGQDRRHRLRGPGRDPGGDRPRGGASCSASASGAFDAGFSPLRELLHAAYDRLDYLHAHRGEISGVRTGFADLDALDHGPPEERPDRPRGPPERRQDEPRPQHRGARGRPRQAQRRASSAWR